jgi:hypothetical protein
MVKRYLDGEKRRVVPRSAAGLFVRKPICGASGTTTHSESVGMRNTTSRSTIPLQR